MPKPEDWGFTDKNGPLQRIAAALEKIAAAKDTAAALGRIEANTVLILEKLDKLKPDDSAVQATIDAVAAKIKANTDALAAAKPQEE